MFALQTSSLFQYKSPAGRRLLPGSKYGQRRAFDWHAPHCSADDNM